MKIRSESMTRRTVLCLVGPVLLETLAIARADEPVVTVHKDPNCGCCTSWVGHLKGAGFTVRVEETPDLDLVRTRLGVPVDLVACHTAEVSGYVIEGHVPALAIRRLLSERPKARGLAVPGMPVGSPGMEGGKPQPYTVVLFGPEGSRSFMRFNGTRPIEG
ncbi:DUF411 domain-containing protein [Bradyrhizobium sp. WSM2793]|uniref:DUF411 domain-containing protein n=1 Tax=Bradyrhizobium sp. WSM2793 TaxID=1038866 RepID=UPI0012FC4D24|nr:DUF411 domain-containing protein [Bradyrhizobium sp. WSM2793]